MYFWGQGCIFGCKMYYGKSFWAGMYFASARVVFLDFGAATQAHTPGPIYFLVEVFASARRSASFPMCACVIL